MRNASLFLVCVTVFAESSTWNSLMSEAQQLQKRGSYADAQSKLEAALSEAERFGPRDSRLGLTLNNLSALLRLEGKFDLAEQHGNRALQIWTDSGGPVTAALNNLAVLFVDQGRYPEAESYYRKAISIEEHRTGPVDARLPSMLTNLATLSFYQGRYTEAEAEYRRALDIQERDGLDTASTLSNMAVLYRRQARYRDAERLY